MHWFGTLGGRSRNGWGSIALQEVVGATPTSRPAMLDNNVLLHGKADLTPFQRPLKECLALEWPHAIGKDEKGVLIWKTEACTSWMAVMRKLAEIKINYRTSLSVIKPFDERQVLALPVTHHTPKELKNDRLASQMRMKVIQHQNQYYGLIFHLPCKIPLEISGKLKGADAQSLIANQAAIWLKVHQHLDKHLQRTGSK
jgi:CRISPR-associated protein Cmr1